jgi:hypothetical protein
MSARQYATGTSVPVEKSLTEIRKLLLAAGATHYAYGEEPEGAAIQFAIEGLHYRFTVRRPRWEDLEKRYREPWRVVQARALDDEWKRRWRARLLWIKAQLEFAEVEPEEFSRAMLAHLVMPNGQTIGTWAVPQIEAMYERGTMPRLLGSGIEE